MTDQDSKAAIKSVNNLLAMDLTIPNYQRPYKWTRKNVAELLDDIEVAISDSRRPDYDKFTYRVGSVILHNQRYFLMAFQEKWKHMRYFRLDRITNIELSEETATPLRSIDGYKNGIDYKRFSSALPYMFSDDPEKITFSIDGEWMVDHIVDWFGFGFTIDRKEGQILITVNASPNAMEYWAMQYLNNIEVIFPLSLRERIANNVKAADEKYNGG